MELENTEKKGGGCSASAQATTRYERSTDPASPLMKWVEELRTETRDNLEDFLKSNIEDIKDWIHDVNTAKESEGKKSAAKGLAKAVKNHFMLVLGSKSQDPRLDLDKVLQHIYERLDSGTPLQEDDFGNFRKTPNWLCD